MDIEVEKIKKIQNEITSFAIVLYFTAAVAVVAAAAQINFISQRDR